MRIILSPAKKMNVNRDDLEPLDIPVFIKQTEEILLWLRNQPHDELQKIWKCNDKIATQNFERISNMDLYSGLTPAILSYDGIAYKYMATAVFEDSQFDYVEEHLRILSAFYGVLKPMDGVRPYRLEMQAKAQVAGTRDLYEYWGSNRIKASLPETERISFFSDWRKSTIARRGAVTFSLIPEVPEKNIPFAVTPFCALISALSPFITFAPANLRQSSAWVLFPVPLGAEKSSASPCFVST